MSYETVFSIVGVLAFLGWGALVVSPFSPRLCLRGALGISILLCCVYLGLLAVSFGNTPSVEFGSLAGVMSGFTDPGHMSAGWTHFLAFDLFIGAWQVKEARAVGIPHLLVLPCLAATFLVGPVGLLLFLGARGWRELRPGR